MTKLCLSVRPSVRLSVFVRFYGEYGVLVPAFYGLELSSNASLMAEFIANYAKNFRSWGRIQLLHLSVACFIHDTKNRFAQSSHYVHETGSPKECCDTKSKNVYYLQFLEPRGKLSNKQKKTF